MNRSLTKRIAWKALFLAFIMLGTFSGNLLKAENIVIGSDVQQQAVTVQQELTIKELFKLIEKQTDFDFFYSSSLNELDNTVNLNLVNTTVDVVLETAFVNSDLEFTIKNKDVMIRKNPNSDQQQTKTVTGVVKDERGETLPGASVVVKGSAIGTSTDFDGNFTIEATEGDVLVFSFMGYTDSEITVGAGNSYNVNMQPSANVLDEIIVSGVASGTSKKKMSVSVAKINSDAINQVPQSDISSALQGKIAGVTVTSTSGSPGSGSNIVLRGATNISGNQSPMILMDGVIMQGSLSDINVDDIETMEVVKGAAASSLYGSRAGNGVIVITSRRGSKLDSGQTTVTVRNEIGIQQVAKYLDLANSHPYELNHDYLDTDTYTKYKYVDYPNGYVTGWDPAINGNRRLKADRYMDMPYRVNNDLQKEMFTNGLSYTNYIGVAHRVNQTNLFISFENNANQGVVIETGGYKRQSFRANIDHSISENIKISASNNYIKTSNDFMGGGTGAFYDVLAMEPDVDLHRNNPDGQKYNYFPSQWNTLVSNPLYDLWKKESTSDKSRFLGSYDVNIRLTDWMSFKGSYSFESQDYRSTDYTPKGTFTGMQTDTNGNGIQPIQSGGSISKYSSKIFNQTYRATMNFSNSWGELDVNGKLSYLYEDNHFENMGASGSNFILPDYPSLGYFKPGTHRAYDKVENIRAENYFAIVSLVYKDRYIFDALYRKDGSSLFGENERWHDYFRVSGAYRITQDITIPGVEELKIRGAYGTSGQRPAYYMQYETYNLDNGNLTKGTAGNKDLKPSQSAEIEIGLDISFLERFRAELTYSNTVTSDQILKSPMFVPAGGFLYQYRNVAELTSNTFEAMLDVNVMNKGDFTWNATFTFDRTRSKITKLDIPPYKDGPRNAFYIREDEVYGGIYGVDFVRTLSQMEAQLPSGASIDDYVVNRHGVVVRKASLGTTSEKAYHVLDKNGDKKYDKIGDINPDFRLGLNTTLTYKNFSFYMLWQWKQGGDMYNMTSQYLVDINRNSMMDQMHVKPENKKSIDFYKSLYDAQSINGFWVEDASYLRLQEASLYYKIKKGSLGKVGQYIDEVSMGVIGRNLLTFTGYTGYDPESGYDGYSFDNYGYPNFRNYSFSFQFKF